MNSIVYNEDCITGMKRYKDKHFDLAIVDPPYGINRDKGFGGFGGFGKPIARKQYKGDWDSCRPNEEYFKEILRVAINLIVWGGNFFTDMLPQNNHWLFWDKVNTMPTFGDGELAYTSFKRNSVKQVTLEYNGLLGKEKTRIHPTQKPVKLYEWILHNYAKQGDLILDTHLGSGSSRIACHKYGFDFTGFELDKEYFEVQEKRYNDFINQLNIFDNKNIAI